MICVTCKKDKNEEDFPFRSRGQEKRHSFCKDCQRRYSREHYKKNKELHNSRRRKNNRIYRERNRQFIKDYLREHPCSICGFSDARALDFHHEQENKRENISDLVRGGRPIEFLMKEVSRCSVVCANCHRILHRERE
jgi:hypothetical protein